ncbi:N-acetylated-alpha-linked acidic dipeptidase 2-like [Haliotis cracherodii]|uniref:N-acetylated-alpha-linked acidic dipeptidase 2-like n=1 Tax=Haliotis cracherodii TaxID=6455 RepID=UPI0039EA1197
MMNNMSLIDGTKVVKGGGKAKYIVCVIVALTCLIVGIVVGRYGLCGTPDGVFLPGVSETINKDGDADVGKRLMDSISNTEIEDNLRLLSKRPHVAGTPADLEQSLMLKEFWENVGFDDVKLTPYNVLLSYPDPKVPNVVRLLDERGGVVYESPLKEADLAGESDPDALPPYNAYSPPGDVKADLVYLNYGRVEDYEWLQSNTGINVMGKIVIARYGKIYRGSLVKNAQDRGAVGVIIFSDPAEYASGNGDCDVYPDTWWLPPSGAQRGTIYGGVGDPLTPGYPAIDSAYRYKVNETTIPMPAIPAHPIGYGIAGKLLRELGGEEAPPSWQGRMNLTYRLGPRFQKLGWKMEMRISTRNVMRTTYNVIGIIKGAVEPDRYVMVGNHRDAWVFGAIDPSSGTAVMMEMSRVVANLVKSGAWRPRRSLMFCSWGAEEYSLIGSTEFVEEYRKTLHERAVAYINIDVAVQANFSLSTSGAPLMYKALYDAAKKVPNPDMDERSRGILTVYDKWLLNTPSTDDYGDPNPLIHGLGSGSDYASLLQQTGVTSVDLSHTFNKTKYSIPLYPLYHSIYETFYIVKKIVDPNFEAHRSVARVALELARSLAESLILPLGVMDYAMALGRYKATLHLDYSTIMDGVLDIEQLNGVILNFTMEAKAFEQRVKTLNRNDPMAVRAVNDQLMMLERAFLDSEGLPDRPLKKHIIFAESSTNSYHGSSFPGLVDLLFKLKTQPNSREILERVKRHYSVILFTIQSAASTLRDVTSFIPRHLT